MACGHHVDGGGGFIALVFFETLAILCDHFWMVKT